MLHVEQRIFFSGGLFIFVWYYEEPSMDLLVYRMCVLF